MDVLRGVLIAAVVVLDPLSGSREHPHLAHAAWDGYTVTDLVLPALVIVSGIGMAFTLRGPFDLPTFRRLARRTIALLLLGVFVYNNVGRLELAGVRLTGVLQMFALSGLLGAVVVAAMRVLARRDRWWLGALVVLVGTALYQRWFRSARADLACLHPEGWCSPFFAVDVRTFGVEHVYRAGEAAWDPEGLIPSVAATLLVLAGWSVGAAMFASRQRERPRPWMLPTALAACGVVLLGLVTPWLAATVEVNKRLHTPAFQTLAVGYVLLSVAAGVVLFDAPIRGRTTVAVAWARRIVAWPLETLGRNPLTIYVLAHLTLSALAVNAHPTAGTWRMWFRQRAVVALGGPLWGDPLFNEVAALLGLMFAVAVLMRVLGWRISL